jgi:hypothetical protein
LTKKPVPIDDLLTWAYRDELPKQEVGGLTGWEQAALLGVMVDQKEDRTTTSSADLALRRVRQASAFLLGGASCRLAGRFAEQVTGDVDQCEAPPFLRMRLEICLNEDLHDSLAGVYLDPDG